MIESDSAGELHHKEGRKLFRHPAQIRAAPLLNIDVNNLDVLKWLVCLVRLRILNDMHRLQPRHHTSEDRVFIVEPRRRRSRDEELRAVCVGTSIRHAHRVWPNFPIQCPLSIPVICDLVKTHRSCFRSSENSSSNSLPQILVPPVPSPSGSPV